MNNSNPSIGPSSSPAEPDEDLPSEYTPLALEDLLELPPSAFCPDDPEFGIEIQIPSDATPEEQRTLMRQRGVLELLMLGVSIARAGKIAKVHRGTIHRWIHHDQQFRAAIRAWQERKALSARGQLLAAADVAAQLLVKRLYRGDLKAATTVLRSTGMLDARQPLLPQSDADPAPQSDRGGKSPDLETRMRKFLASLSPQESTRLLQALAESSQPKLPEASEKTEEPEKPGDQPEAGTSA